MNTNNYVKDIQEVIENGIPEEYGDAENWAIEKGAERLPWQPEQAVIFCSDLINNQAELLEQFKQKTGFDLAEDLQNIIDMS
jgi:hypothetical protein